MAGFYLDHNIAHAVAPLLRREGYEVVVADKVGDARIADDNMLLKAAQLGLVLVTHNVKDFRMLHRAWRRWSSAWSTTQQHPGILLVSQKAKFPAAVIAQQLHGFVRSPQFHANELFELRATGNWLAHILREGEYVAEQRR